MNCAASASPLQNVIAVDTSTPHLGLVLRRDTDILASIIDTSAVPHSLTLFPLIEKTLTDCNLTLADFDLLAVNNGPGSFTGLRIGLAAVTALAWTLGKPVIGINPFDALAYSLGEINIPIVILLPASKNEVFWGARQLQPDSSIIKMDQDRVLSIAQVNELFRDKFVAQELLILGDSALTICPELSSNHNWRLVALPSSYALQIANYASHFSIEALQQKVSANYIRPSAAEAKSSV